MAVDRYPNVPRTSLRDASKRYKQSRSDAGLPALGAPPKLSSKDEDKLYRFCLLAAERALHQSKANILFTAMKMGKERGVRFDTVNGLPSQSWWLRFSGEYPDMALLRAQPLSRDQAHAADPATTRRFFHLLRNIVTIMKLTAGQLWMADETVCVWSGRPILIFAVALQMLGKINPQGQVWAPKEQRDSKVLSADQYTKHLTILPACSADGKMSTPLFIMEV